ncbi:MAG: 50S ribosomal protein L23 [Tenericutes bacterium GWC2_34_14]|jgi:large subunit ribosomal protein L23|nr:MAG: 50S ribosomal protein L23 [Tenericutes bacterium GWA2_35_7]OHE29062.1 MAG: 50S ribosomal protein L23 [Tenericutes bacterium GWC2_34_14]OHE34015.1 MAG: 50S ribosomal protein L23 [Tenericutes bacterium GWE2_34_108]OHE35348.1 MAG: 50S ribosomal protein L23 [Tenericutes bacterium GWF1_35_14]OHE38381.1 MAG: 50S ribosomal protein L23 [Tenericutes bacterium GWF2_35_184]OHE42716.1 MAG: 50S ribosomal protein L23 [Tenericutes bacterium RIFOXYA2_FULL_36_32]OHE43242.1 MAG: 50S ribosomal protein L
MTKYYDILKAPIITEQSTKLIESQNRYTFKVDPKANKVEIKKAVETIFNVKVLSVNTVNVLPKFKRMGKHEGYKSAYKKAVVKLAEGQKIDAFTI